MDQQLKVQMVQTTSSSKSLDDVKLVIEDGKLLYNKNGNWIEYNGETVNSNNSVNLNDLAEIIDDISQSINGCQLDISTNGISNDSIPLVSSLINGKINGINIVEPTQEVIDLTDNENDILYLLDLADKCITNSHLTEYKATTSPVINKSNNNYSYLIECGVQYNKNNVTYSISFITSDNKLGLFDINNDLSYCIRNNRIQVIGTSDITELFITNIRYIHEF